MYDGTSAGSECVGVESNADGYTTCYNCVIEDLTSTNVTTGFWNVAVYNCYAGGLWKCFLSCAAGDYCSSSITGTYAPPGANSREGDASVDQFVSLGSDYHLKAGADLINVGNDAYSNEWDIDGPFSGTRNDIGCHEYVVATSGHPTMRRLGGIPGMGLTGRVNW